MSAAFSIGDRDYWGTNGAIETYLGRLARLAVDTPGIDPVLAAWPKQTRAVPPPDPAVAPGPFPDR
jgi:hypothetical protein